MKRKNIKKIEKILVTAALTASMLTVTACGSTTSTSGSENTAVEETTASTEESVEEVTEVETLLDKIDNTAWKYNSDDNVYYQVGISYCETPADATYETLGVFVPGEYMTATDNGDGTYTCEINEEATVGNYTAATAPIVIPVNTPGYSAMSAPTDYSSEVADYTKEGFVYVWAGCRGRDAGAPAGVTDLKAAIRYIRYNEGNIPGSTERIFSFGMSGGGAQSALLGSTGDSDLYTAYLEEIGAVMGVSDAVCGSMCWCPITSLDIADEAYEWNLGVTRTGLSDDEQALSDDLAEAFATYINNLGIEDEDGNVLTLETSEEGIYQAGSYYEYVKSVIEDSLENFLKETTFPYEAGSSSEGFGGMGGGQMPGGGMPSGEMPSDLPDGAAPSDLQGGQMPDGTAPSDLGSAPTDLGTAPADGTTSTDGTAPADGNVPSDLGTAPSDLGTAPTDGTTQDGEAAQYAQDGIDRDTTSSSGLSLTGTYETAQDYIDALNADGEWVTYDAETGEVTITSIADFVTRFKNASKSLGAFDQLDAGQGENTLFGYGDGNGAHFDEILADLLANNDYGADYASSYAEDLAKTDSEGNTVDVRSDMYNPLYYLSDAYEGYQTSNVATYWRIRTGIDQSDTALTTEINLALSLESYGCDVDFATIWGQGHTQAESTGDSTTNFIEWVNECLSE